MGRPVADRTFLDTPNDDYSRDATSGDVRVGVRKGHAYHRRQYDWYFEMREQYQREGAERPTPEGAP